MFEDDDLTRIKMLLAGVATNFNVSFARSIIGALPGYGGHITLLATKQEPTTP